VCDAQQDVPLRNSLSIPQKLIKHSFPHYDFSRGLNVSIKYGETFSAQETVKVIERVNRISRAGKQSFKHTLSLKDVVQRLPKDLWVETLEATGPALLTLHCVTRNQQQQQHTSTAVQKRRADGGDGGNADAGSASIGQGQKRFRTAALSAAAQPVEAAASNASIDQAGQSNSSRSRSMVRHPYLHFQGDAAFCMRGAAAGMSVQLL
jgi:hypothetical protein